MTGYAPQATPTQVAHIGDLELDTILKLKQVVRDLALVFADDQEDQVPHYLLTAVAEVEYNFLNGREHDASTSIMFTTLRNLLLAA